MSRGTARPFTSEEDARIVAQWSTGLLCELAGPLGRSPSSIASRARLLVQRGLIEEHARFYQHPWSDEEEDLLRDLLGTMSLAAIGKRLGRTAEAVRIHKTRLGLAQLGEFLTLRDVGRLMGVDSHLVRRWIDEGLLTGRKSPVRCGRNLKWRCQVDDLTRFLRRHPERYDRRRIEEEPYRGIARETYRKDPLLTMPEAARRLHVNIETLRRHLRRGWLEGVKVPCAGAHGAWLVRQSQLEQFRSRKPESVGVIAIRSIAGQKAREKAARPAWERLARRAG